MNTKTRTRLEIPTQPQRAGRPGTPAPTQQPPSRRGAALAITTVVAAAVGTVGLWIAVSGDSTTEAPPPPRTSTEFGADPTASEWQRYLDAHERLGGGRGGQQDFGPTLPGTNPVAPQLSPEMSRHFDPSTRIHNGQGGQGLGPALTGQVGPNQSSTNAFEQSMGVDGPTRWERFNDPSTRIYGGQGGQGLGN